MVGSAAIRHKLHELKGIIVCGEDPDTAYSTDSWVRVTCDKCNAKKIRPGDKLGAQVFRKAKRARLKAAPCLKVRSARSRKETDESLDSDFGFIPRKPLNFGDTWNMPRTFYKKT